MVKHVSRKLKIKKMSKHTANEKYKSLNASEKSSNKNSIKDYLYLCTNFESHITEFRNSWKVTLEENLVFYKIDISNQPTIVVSIKIDKSLKVNVFTEHGKVKRKHLESLLNSKTVLEYWSQLRRLLRYFDAEDYSGYVSIKYNLTESLRCLKSCQNINSAKGDTFGLEPKLKFLQNQVNALLHNRYTTNMILLAYSIYLKSSSCYKYIQSLEFLILPKEKDLLKYVSETDKVLEKKYDTHKTEA